MKKLIPFIVPLLIVAFLNLTINHAHAVSAGRIVVQYSANCKNWEAIADITDRVTAAKAAGLTELHLEILVDAHGNSIVQNPANLLDYDIQEHFTEIKKDIGFFRAESTVRELFIPFDFNVISPKVSVPPIQCGAGLIIGILVLIVAGIIIYLIVRTCQRLLPDDDE